MNGNWRTNKYRIDVKVPKEYYDVEDKDLGDISGKLANMIEAIEDFANGDKEPEDVIETYDRINGIILGQNW